ncbi:MAG: TRAP transporter fused permease subunit [Rhodobacteraceae bacterium]|nr:TRAP transporter fused permease subunit [Paracoccaceae bacterium]
MRIARWLGLGLVAIGMVNTIPAIPGLDSLVRELSGITDFRIRQFPYQFLYPVAFLIMMTVVALRHSAFRAWQPRGRGWRSLGLAADIILVVTALVVVLAYWVEISSVCLIDQVTGERAALIARSLQQEIEFARLYGLPVPDSVDDPNCLNTLGLWLFAVMFGALAVFLAWNVRVWGLPLVMVSIAVAVYAVGTVLIWYIWGAEGANRYAITMLGGEPRQLADGLPNIRSILVNNANGLLGRFMDVLLNTVFPYLVLGSLFGISAGGQSLIKLAFLWTRRLRGGPAHAAIVSSALFGTISGGPVVNVLSTGVLTIPMMIKRGFSRSFAGGIEAAASSGGSIMPPVMGVAAFVLAALTLVPYREVIIAATIPAIAYFSCLFLSVVFQARRQGIEALGEITDDMRLVRSDWINLVMIVAPIVLILVLLLTPKEAVGCGPLGALFGVEQTLLDGRCQTAALPWPLALVENSAGDAGSAGWWAVVLLFGLLFLDPKTRARPLRIVEALSQSGLMVSTLYLMFLAVSIIDFCLNLTGLTTYISLDILSWLRSLDIAGSGAALFLALGLTAALAILLGMGMPAVPAYINVALLMGPLLTGLGIATFTAHMFIFYFAIASAITPPVAIAAFAAASISKSDPMVTGFSAVRSGIVIFAIPFVFCFHPELLLIEAAVLGPDRLSGGPMYVPGYDGTLDLAALGWLLLRLVLALYLLSSALARYDRVRLKLWEVGLRMVAAVACLSDDPRFWLPALAVGGGLIGRQYLVSAGKREARP